MRRLGSHLNVIALALLLTVLSHDLVMAGDPHGVGHHPMRMASMPGPLMPEMAHRAHHVLLSEAVHTRCGMTEGAGVSSPATPRISSSLVQSPASGADDGEVTGITPERNEPDHPPNVRRALLQIYRN